MSLVTPSDPAMLRDARTARELYSGHADWNAIGSLKSSVSIPVLGNGDIWEAWDALRMVRSVERPARRYKLGLRTMASGGESLVVYFDFNEVDLGARAQRQLEIVANLLRDDPQRKLRLSGHTVAVGSDAYNRQLSAARAFAVKNALAALGVSGDQVVTEGLGTLRPLDPNTKPDGSDNPEGRSRNRRTEIFLDF